MKVLRREADRKPPGPMKLDWPIHDSFQAEYTASRPLVWALIKEMSRRSSDAGAEFLVSLSPHYMRSPGDNPPWRVASFLHEYEEDARAAGIPGLNCVPEYFAEGGNDRFEVKAGSDYLNPKGNALIARATFRWLKDRASTGAFASSGDSVGLAVRLACHDLAVLEGLESRSHAPRGNECNEWMSGSYFVSVPSVGTRRRNSFQIDWLTLIQRYWP